MNLAVGDILFAAFIIPKVFFNFIFTHPGGVTGTSLCKLLIRGTVAWVGELASIITLVAVAIERHHAAVYPFGNKWKLTKRKLKVPASLISRYKNTTFISLSRIIKPCPLNGYFDVLSFRLDQGCSFTTAGMMSLPACLRCANCYVYYDTICHLYSYPYRHHHYRCCRCCCCCCRCCLC